MNDGNLTGETRPPVLDREPGAGICGILDESAASALVQRCASPTKPSVWDHPSAPPALVLLCLAVVAAAVSLCPPAVAHAIVREHGPVESLTAAGYLAIAAWLLVARDETGEAGNGSAFARTAAFAVALLAARELDLDKAFTTHGVLQSRLYLSPEASAAEKAVAALVVVTCLLVLLRLRRHVPAWLTDLRRRRCAYAHTVAVALAMLPATKLLDVTPRLLRDDVGLLLPVEIKARVGAFEEVLELGIPLLLALALLQYRPNAVAVAAGAGPLHGRCEPVRAGDHPAQPAAKLAADRRGFGFPPPRSGKRRRDHPGHPAAGRLAPQVPRSEPGAAPAMPGPDVAST